MQRPQQQTGTQPHETLASDTESEHAHEQSAGMVQPDAATVTEQAKPASACAAESTDGTADDETVPELRKDTVRVARTLDDADYDADREYRRDGSDDSDELLYEAEDDDDDDDGDADGDECDGDDGDEEPVRHMVVLGASSEIAIATIMEFARTGPWRFSLCGRNMSVLEKTAVSLTSTWGCQCSCHYFDTGMPVADMNILWQRLTAEADQVSEYEGKSAGGVDTLFCAAGYLGNQQWAQNDPSEGEEIMRSNCTGLMPLISMAASYFEQRGQGCIMVITSVAGDRGRCSNYFYGASKAAMSAFLSGMRVRLYQSGVSVVDIRPGYVLTRMVAGRKLPPYITASTETVARDIVKAWHSRPAVLYTMWLWRHIMCVTRHLPDFIFKRLNMF